MKYYKLAPPVQTNTYPKLWGIECQYCLDWDNIHEKEIMAKARRLCTKNKHFPDFVQASLDLADHSKMDKAGQMRFLLKIHTESGCDCLDHLIERVDQATKIQFDPRDLRAILTRSTSVPSTGHQKHDQQGSTDLSEGKNGNPTTKAPTAASPEPKIN